MGVPYAQGWVEGKGWVRVDPETGDNPVAATFETFSQGLDRAAVQMQLRVDDNHVVVEGDNGTVAVIRDNGITFGWRARTVALKASQQLAKFPMLDSVEKQRRIAEKVKNELGEVIKEHNPLVRRKFGTKTLIIEINDGRLRRITKMAELARRRGGSAATYVNVGEGGFEKIMAEMPLDGEYTIRINGKEEADRVFDELLEAACRYRNNPEAGIDRPESTDDVKAFAEAVKGLGKVRVERTVGISGDSDIVFSITADLLGLLLVPNRKGAVKKLNLEMPESKNVGDASRSGGSGQGRGSESESEQADDGDAAAVTAAAAAAADGQDETTTRGTKTGESGAGAPSEQSEEIPHNPAVSPAIAKVVKGPQLTTTLISVRGLDLVFGGVNGDARRRLACLIGNDYTLRGLFGFTWKIFDSRLAEDLYNKPWTSPEELVERAQRFLDRMSSQTAEDTAWRGSGADGRVQKMPHRVVITLELAKTLIAGFQTLKQDASIPLVDRSTPPTSAGHGLVFNPPLAPERVRGGAPRSAGEREDDHTASAAADGQAQVRPASADEAQRRETARRERRLARDRHPHRPTANALAQDAESDRKFHPPRSWPRSDGRQPPQPSKVRVVPMTDDESVYVAIRRCCAEGAVAVSAEKEEPAVEDVSAAAATTAPSGDQDGGDEDGVKRAKSVNKGSETDGTGEKKLKKYKPRLEDVFAFRSTSARTHNQACRVLIDTSPVDASSPMVDSPPPSRQEGDGVAGQAGVAAELPRRRRRRTRPNRSSQARRRALAAYPGRRARRPAAGPPEAAQPQPASPSEPGAGQGAPPPSSAAPHKGHESHGFPPNQSRAMPMLLKVRVVGFKMSQPWVMSGFKELVRGRILRGSELSYAALGAEASGTHGVSIALARLKAVGVRQRARERENDVGVETPAQQEEREAMSAAAAAASAEGWDLPGYNGGSEADRPAYVPFETVYRLDISHKPLELEALGNTIGANLLGNYGRALDGVLRESHRQLDAPTSVRDALARAPAQQRDAFAVALQPALAGLLAETPFRRASAEAGRPESDEPVPNVQAPPSLYHGLQDAVELVVGREEGLVREFVQFILDVVGRLLAQRDVALAYALGLAFPQRQPGEDTASFEARADKEFITAEENKGPFKLASRPTKASKKDVAKIEPWEVVTKSPFAQMFDAMPGDTKLKAAALVLWVRLARGEDAKLFPSFAPTYISMDIAGLMRVLDPRNLFRFIQDLESLATSAYRETASFKLKKGSKLLKTFRRLFEPRTGTWSTTPTKGDLSAVELMVRAGLEKELNELYKTVHDAFGTTQSLATLCSVGGRVEVTRAFFRQDDLPRNFIPTGSLQVSAFDAVLGGVRQDILVKKAWEEESSRAQGCRTAGEYFQDEIVGVSFSQLDAKMYEDYPGIVEYVGDCTTGKLVPRQVYPLTVDGCANAVEARRIQPTPAYRPRGAPRLRVGVAEVHPATSMIALKTARRVQTTRSGGNPTSWPYAGGGEEKRQYLLGMLRGTTDAQCSWNAVDAGFANPVAIFAATPDSSMPSGRAESTIVQTSGMFRQMQKEHNRARSMMANSFGEDFEGARLVDLDGQVELEVVEEGEGCGNAMYEQKTMLGQVLIGMFLDTNEAWIKQARQHKTRRKAYVQSSAYECALVMVGGRNVPLADEAGDMLVVVAVGWAQPEHQGGASRGADYSRVMLREVEVQLHGLGVRTLFIMANEYMTSQHCPRPWCVNDRGERSYVTYPRREDGSECLRVVYCPTCGGIFNRDGGAAANILAMLLLWLAGGVWPWRSSLTV